MVIVQPVLDRITGLTENSFHPVDLSVFILDLRLQILLQFLNHDKMSWAFLFSYPVIAYQVRARFVVYGFD